MDLAIAAAKAFGVRIDLVHVLDDADSWWPETAELQAAAEAAKEDATQYEAALEAELGKEMSRCTAAGVECDAFVVRGRPWRIIPEVAAERGSFLITIGPYGSSGPRSVDSQGATEGTVKNETAEAIADITSTGDTLRANHLKVLADGPVHRSQATLFKSRKADWTDTDRAVLSGLCGMLGVEG